MKLLIYAIVLTLLLGTWGAWDEPSPSFEIIDSSLFQRVETYRKAWNSLGYPVAPLACFFVLVGFGKFWSHYIHSTI